MKKCTSNPPQISRRGDSQVLVRTITIWYHSQVNPSTRDFPGFTLGQFSLCIMPKVTQALKYTWH